MKKNSKAKWMAVAIAASCAGCATGSGAKSPGFFASMMSPFSSVAANKPARPEDHEDAISLNKKPKPTADFFIAAGKLAYSRGDKANARAQYEHAIKIEPKNVRPHLYLAQLYDEMQMHSEAEQVLTGAVSIAPMDPTPLNDLAVCLMKQQRYDEAIDYLQQAITLRPHQNTYRNNIAEVLVKAGRPREAFDHLTVVHSVAEAHYNIGYLLRQNGEIEPARQHAIAALQVDPGMNVAQQLLTELGGGNPHSTVHQASRPVAKEVAAPRNLRAQAPAIESEAEGVEIKVAPKKPGGYYEGLEKEDEQAAPPAEVLARKPAAKTGRKSTAELRARIEDSSTPVLR